MGDDKTVRSKEFSAQIAGVRASKSEAKHGEAIARTVAEGYKQNNIKISKGK